MSTEILKEFLVAVGFKVDQASYKKQAEAVDKVSKQLGQLDRDDQTRVTAEQRRHEVRKRNAEGLALALGGVAAAAATAATVVGAAMVKIAGGFDNLYFVSQRTGASANNLKSLGYAFSQVGSTAESALQAVESFAKARRTNPGINAMLRGYGVDTRGDASDVLMNSIDAIQKKHPYFSGAQVAEQLGISEEQFETLTRYKDQIKAYRVEYEHLQKTLNVNSDETARASASVQRSLGSLSAIVGVLMEKLYTTLAPVLERIVKGFKDWIDAHPEQVEKIMRGLASAVETVGGALIKVGDWLGDEDNQKKLADYWDKFTRRITEAAKQIKELLELLIKIGKYLGFGPSTADDPLGMGKFVTNPFGTVPQDQAEAEGKKPGLFRRGLNAVKRGLGIGGDDMTPTPGDKTSIKGKTFAAKAPGVMKRLMADFGLTKDEAAIVLGNLGHESAGFTAFEEGDNGPGRGWAQWTDPGRKARFFKYARDNKLDPRSDEANYGFLKWELENSHKSSIRALKRAKTYDQKMIDFEGDFEGAGKKNYRSRFNYAQRAREAYDRAEAEQSKAPTAPGPSAPSQPRSAPRPSINMTPGGFNVEDYFKSPPLGSLSSTTNNSKSVQSTHGDINVTVQGGSGNPDAMAASFKRAAADVQSIQRRDMQTAIR